MTDIGFGLIDRRTVIVVLFSMVLSQVLWNNQFPIDTTSVSSIFLGLVFLTGYLYLARSIYRLPVALVLSIIFMPSFSKDTIAPWPQERLRKLKEDAGQIRFKRFKEFALRVILYVGVPLVTLLGIPLFVFYFGKAVDQASKEWGNRDSIREAVIATVFGALDRIGLVAISALATVASFRPVVIELGIIGLILMLAIFVFRGDFSGLIRDILEKQESDAKEKNRDIPTVDVKNSERYPMYVRIVSDVRDD